MTEEDNQYYVCVGASAGGLEALEEFFTSMPDDTGFIFIVIQHLSPDYKSLMGELLARHTDMKISIIEDGMETKPNEVYLIPPSKNLTIFHGKLYLEERNKKSHINLPIDIFLKSLAKDQGKKAIGIILSGTGSDGTLGVKAIKEAGGLVMVQTEESSKFDGMPRSSISTGLVDYILPPEKMPDELISFIKHPHQKSILNRALDGDDENFDDLTKVSLIMRDHGGIDFSYYKESTILRRLDRRLKINRVTSLADYVAILRKSDEEKDTLQREFLIGVTTFFRDPEAFESLRKNVLPYIDYHKGIVRIWSAGCSTGEEVYSIAILFNEYLEKNNIDCEVKIFATDIDPRALDVAGTGFYSESIMAEVDIRLVDKYFDRYKGGYQIKESIRRMIVFAEHNILKDPPFSKLDLLVCRNLFIYIKSEQQKRILSTFYFSLKAKGYMFLGSSETIGELSNAFSTIDNKWKIFKCKKGYKSKLTTDIALAQRRNTHLSDHRSESSLQKVPMKSDQLLFSVIAEIAPPSVIIDEEDNIVQVINDVSKVINMQPGKFSNNFNSNMSKEAALFVNNIIRRLKRDSDEVLFSNVVLKEDSKQTYSLSGKKIIAGKRNYFMISFIEHEESEEEDQSIKVDMSEEVRIRVKELEKELQIAQESLQATIEELETSNEELQSSNEELIAANEELQSTNEELQSVNEELYTVNNEYQSKIEELTNLSNDLSNLMRNTELGALYLDDRLYIRRVTPMISEVTNIMKTDVGRSIKDISVMRSYPKILEDIELVASTLRAIDREIKDESGTYWLIRIRPYRTEYNAVRGVIVTFINIDRLKSIQDKYNLINYRLGKSLNLGDMAHWTLDIETGHMEFSPTKKTMLGYKEEEFPTDLTNRNKLIHPADIEEYETALNKCIDGKKEYWDVAYRILRKDGGYSTHHDHGVVYTYDENGEPETMLGVITDISKYLRKVCID